MFVFQVVSFKLSIIQDNPVNMENLDRDDFCSLSWAEFTIMVQVAGCVLTCLYLHFEYKLKVIVHLVQEWHELYSLISES
jgi:hypothetical protein